MKCINLTFEAFAKPPLTLQQVKSGTHYSAKDSFPKIFGKDSDKARDLFYHYYLKIYGDEVPEPFEGVEEMLKFIKSQNIYTALLSNKKGDVLRKEVALRGYDKYFDNIVGSTDAPEDKPSIIAVKHTLKDINPSTSVWFVGDTEVDMLCATTSGCTPIFFGDGETTFETVKINSYAELLELI